MRVFDMEHRVEVRTRFLRPALLDEESGQNEMGIGIAAISRNGTPQVRFGFLLASPQ